MPSLSVSRRASGTTCLSTSTASIHPSRPDGNAEPAGFTYYEGLELIAALAKRGEIVGIDLVEVAPDYDHSGSTAIQASQIC